MWMQLQRRELLCLAGGRGLAVCCLAGELWVTQHGDRKDVVLAPGEQLALDRPGLAVVQALTPARLAVGGGQAQATQWVGLRSTAGVPTSRPTMARA
jgi:hypothetical protein